jgi:hypothetical protein
MYANYLIIHERKLKSLALFNTFKGQEDFAGIDGDGDGVEQDGKKVQQPQLLSRTRSKKQTCYSSGCCDCYIAHIALTSVLLIINTGRNALIGISLCQCVHNVLQQK